ncbi:4697_t:CDS:2 [Entrophospora sp. SA101]|nr:4697_t:CDS:2 [Entrophospora sp. SA101]
MNSTQLDYFFNKTQTETINLKYLNFNQPSELVIADYPNLKGIDGRSIPHLTQLTITNCPQLEKINIEGSKNNQQLILNNLPNLKRLFCSSNNLTTLDLSDYNGLEYLPESVKYFKCSVDKRKEAKVKAIYNLFADEKGEQEKLEEQLKLLQEQKAKLEELNQKLLERIPFLEKQIEEYEFLIKEQKTKIVNNYLLSFTEEEKDALEELIKVHKNYLEAKKQKSPSFGFKQKYDELYYRLENKLEQVKEKEQALANVLLIKQNIAGIEENIKSVHLTISSPNYYNYITMGDIEVMGGHAMIGNTIGDNTNLSHNQYATRIEEVELEAKILQPTYGIPSSNTWLGTKAKRFGFVQSVGKYWWERAKNKLRNYEKGFACLLIMFIYAY